MKTKTILLAIVILLSACSTSKKASCDAYGCNHVDVNNDLSSK